MKILFDDSIGGDQSWSPPTFKDCAAADVRNVFLNSAEFAQVRTVIYDGVAYEDIPVVECGPTEEKRSSVIQMQNDFGQGLYKRSITLYCSGQYLNGFKPEQGTHLSMNERKGSPFFHKYRVAESRTEMGMFRLELEEVDE